QCLALLEIAIQNQSARLLGRVSHGQEPQILSVDVRSAENFTANPIEQSLPVRRAVQDQRKALYFLRLNEGEGLEHLVERAEAAREKDEAFGIFHEHGLAAEEITEVDADADIGIDILFPGKLDIAANRQTADVVGSPVRCLHDAGSAAGNDREARLSEPFAEVPGGLVHGVRLLGPSR